MRLLRKILERVHAWLTRDEWTDVPPEDRPCPVAEAYERDVAAIMGDDRSEEHWR